MESARPRAPARTSREARAAIPCDRFRPVVPCPLVPCLSLYRIWKSLHSDRNHTQCRLETRLRTVMASTSCMALLCPRPPVPCHCDHMSGDAPYECCYADSQVSEHAGAEAKI